jgi:hypothetical protein
MPVRKLLSNTRVSPFFCSRLFHSIFQHSHSLAQSLAIKQSIPIRTSRYLRARRSEPRGRRINPRVDLQLEIHKIHTHKCDCGWEVHLYSCTAVCSLITTSSESRTANLHGKPAFSTRITIFIRGVFHRTYVSSSAHRQTCDFLPGTVARISLFLVWTDGSHRPRPVAV